MALPHDELPNCSLARTLSVLGDRWSLLIVREAIMGSTRFDEFQQRLGIARNILDKRLKALVEEQVMIRTISPSNARIPLYTLSDKGWELVPSLAGLMQWGDRWMDNGKGVPVMLLDPAHMESLARLRLEDAEGSTVDPRTVQFAPGPGADARTRMRLKIRRAN